MFDTLNWNYLDDVIRQMALWREMEKMGITYIYLFQESLGNGVATQQFKLQKGMCQGDPLSIFQFIIATKGLQVALAEALDKGLYKGVNLTNNDSNLSTIQFANDTLFLGEWNISNALNLMRLLRCFHICLGLKINIDKCRVMGIGVHKE